MTDDPDNNQTHGTDGDTSDVSAVPKESVESEEADADKGTLDVGLNIITQQGGSLLVLVASSIGFLIGFAIGATFIDGFFCIFQTMQQVLGSFSGATGGAGTEAGFATDLQGQVTNCFWSNLFTFLPISFGVVGGLAAAFPMYKASKAVANGKYLRTLI